jgi:hypothetical protein
MAQPQTETVPWSVRFALAAYDSGKPLPPWLLMAVQMLRYGYGCSACGSQGR